MGPPDEVEKTELVLTIENAGALIPGKITKEDFMETRTVRALRGFYFDRKVVKLGTIIKLPKIFAIEVCASNKAEMVDPAIEEKSEAAEKSAETKDTGPGKPGEKAKK